MPSLALSHKHDLATLTGLAERDLALLWPQWSTADAARDGLLEVLPRLIALYGSAAASLAADWFDEMRAEAGVRGRFQAVPAELPDAGRAAALARWAVTPLYATAPDFPTALVKASGGLQRIVANADRQTITGSSVADPRARGWQRVGSGASCDFCSMLIGRGAVYKESTSDFLSHDHCNCSSEPVWK